MRNFRNPLDPGAWLREEHRFDLPGEGADIRLGVHATTNVYAALAYAVHKASQEGDLPGGEPNCGIVLMLDLDGLKPIPEADALVISQDQDVVACEMRMDRRILESVGDDSALIEAVRDFIEDQYMFDEGKGERPFEPWFEAYWKEFVYELDPFVILGVLEQLSYDNPEYFVAVIRNAIKTDEFPLELWAEAIGQWRFMTSVGFDRLISVCAVHPVEAYMVDDPEFDPDDKEGPTVFDMMEVGAPRVVTLWETNSGIPVNAMYHGTDVLRARKAFPEIERFIKCPWPYGQPEGVGPL
jgi:hypothetical protein